MHTCHLWLTGTFFHTCNTQMSLFFVFLQITFLITSCYSRQNGEQTKCVVTAGKMECRQNGQLDKMESKLDIILLLRGSSFQPLPLTPTGRSETPSPAIVKEVRRE